MSKLLEVLGIWVVVDGKVGFHGPELVVLEGRSHAFGLLGRWIRLLVPVQVVCLILITTCCSNSGQTIGQWKLPHQIKRWKAYDTTGIIKQKTVISMVSDT